MTHLCVIAVNSKVTHYRVMPSNDPHFRLRLPAELKAKIEKVAKETSRSLNAVIVDALEDQFADDGRMARLQEAVADAADMQKDARAIQRLMAASYLSAVTIGREIPHAEFERQLGISSPFGRFITEFVKVSSNFDVASLATRPGDWEKLFSELGIDTKLRK